MIAWSNAPSDILAFPCNYLFHFMEQHGILAPNRIPEWRWVKGGARSYVEAMLATLDAADVHLGAPVTRVSRLGDAVTIVRFGCRAHQVGLALMIFGRAVEAPDLRIDQCAIETPRRHRAVG